MRRAIVNATLPTTFEGEELQLAHLAFVKLNNLLEGTLSVGLPALVTGVPEPCVFLDERFPVLESYAVVLHSTRRNTNAIQDALNALHLRLSALVSTGDFTLSALQSSQAAFNDVCDALEEFARQTSLDASPLSNMKSVILKIFEGLESLYNQWHSHSGDASCTTSTRTSI